MTQETPAHENSDKPAGKSVSVHTLKTDAAELLKKKDVSFIDLVVKEEAHRREEAELGLRERPKRTPPAATIGLVAAIIVVVAGGAMLLLSRRAPATNTARPPVAFIAPNVETIVFVGQSDPASLASLVRDLDRDRLPVGEMRYVPLQFEQLASPIAFADARAFFNRSGIRPPQDFLESITGRWNLLLSYGQINTDTIFVFETDDPTRALAGLLSWETRMGEDLLLFSTFSRAASVLFSDRAIQNIDARVSLLSEPGAIAPAYAIFSGRFVIIATSLEALEDVLARFIEGRGGW